MAIFVTGTNTNIGKTLISSWLCLHTKAGYFKPIQTGSIEETDSSVVARLSKVKTYAESYIFKPPVSPHLAAALANTTIELDNIHLPNRHDLIIEGAGGILVPLNATQLIIDLVAQWQLPILLVASSELGTINHTCLTLLALRQRALPILGVILNGSMNSDNKHAIEFYGKIPVLAEFSPLPEITTQALQDRALPALLTDTLAPYL